MSDNKTTLKLHFEGYSQHKIAEIQKVSRDRSVSPIIKAARNHGLTLEKIIDLSEEEISALLFLEKKIVPVYVQPNYEHCHKELLKDGTKDLGQDRWQMQFWIGS